MVKNRHSIKKEFDDFASKIARLEALKQELNGLDSRGFESDVKMIRSRLKDVESIPDIERDMGVLREKIREKHENKGSENKAHLKLASVSDSLKRKIGEIEKEIEEKRKLANRGKLTHVEKQSLHEIPKLERKLNDLKGEFEEHTTASTVKVDSGVGIIVDNKFGDFLTEIKAQLSQRLREKEVYMDEKMKKDLQEHQEEFSHKYKDLVNEFHQKWKDRVNNDLKKEVHARFEEELEARLKEEERKLVAQLVAENLKRLVADKKKLVHNMHEELEKKSNLLKRNFEQQRKAQSKEIEKERKRMRDKIASIKGKEKLHNQGVLGERKKLIEERVALEKHFAEMKKEEEHSVVKAKAIDRKEYAHKIALLRNEMHKKLYHIELASDVKRKKGIAREIEFLKKKMEEHANDYINAEKNRLEDRIKAVKEQEQRLANKSEKVRAMLARERKDVSDSFDRVKKNSKKEIEKIRKEVDKKRKELDRVKEVDREAVKRKIEKLNEDKTKNRSELHKELEKLHREKQAHEKQFLNKLAELRKKRSEGRMEMRKEVETAFRDEREAIQKDKEKIQMESIEMHNELVAERSKIEKKEQELRNRLKNKLHSEKTKLERKEEEQLAEDKRRITELIANENRKKLAIAKAEMRRRLREENKRIAKELSKMRNQELAMKRRAEEKQKQIIKAKDKLSNSFNKLYAQQQKALEQARKAEEQKFEQHKRESDAQFQKRVEAVRMKMKEDMANEVKKKVSEAEKMAEKEVRDKEHVIRKQLEHEYNARLQLEMKKKEADLANKKAELERHVLEQAKKIFN